MFSQDFVPEPLPKKFTSVVGILRKIGGKYVVESPIRKWTIIPERMGKTMRTWLKLSHLSKVTKSRMESLVGRPVRASGLIVLPPRVGAPFNQTMVVVLLSVMGIQQV